MLIFQLAKNVSALKNVRAQGPIMMSLKYSYITIANIYQSYVIFLHFLSSINGVFRRTAE